MCIAVLIFVTPMRIGSVPARADLTSVASAFGAHLFDLQFHNSDLVTIGDG